MKFNRLNDLESLSFIKTVKMESVGLGVKRAVYSIGNTPFQIEVDFWKGDDFYSYDVKKVVMSKNSISVKSNEFIEDGEWDLEDVLPLLPEKIQLGILMNLDLFCEL